jgi:hypothetical protein
MALRMPVARSLLKAIGRQLSWYWGAAQVGARHDTKIQMSDVKLDHILSSGGDQTVFWMPY